MSKVQYELLEGEKIAYLAVVKVATLRHMWHATRAKVHKVHDRMACLLAGVELVGGRVGGVFILQVAAQGCAILLLVRSCRKKQSFECEIHVIQLLVPDSYTCNNTPGSTACTADSSRFFSGVSQSLLKTVTKLSIFCGRSEGGQIR